MEKLLPVNFNGDTVYLVGVNGEPFVPIKPIAENLGLGWQAQHRKLLEDARRWQARTVKVQTAGGRQGMLCLPLRKLPAWLMSISPRKVKPELREKLLRYQEECDKVLWDYWTRGWAENPRLNGQPQAGRLQALPFYEYEATGYSYLWYLPLGLLARILQVDADDLLKLLPPGTYIENPDLVNFLRERFPEASSYLKDPVIVFDSGLRRLFIKNLMAERKDLPETGALEAFKHKVFETLEVLEKRGISFSLALKLVKARKAGLTQEETGKALGFSRSKAHALEQRLKDISFWSLV